MGSEFKHKDLRFFFTTVLHATKAIPYLGQCILLLLSRANRSQCAGYRTHPYKRMLPKQMVYMVPWKCYPLILHLDSSSDNRRSVVNTPLVAPYVCIPQRIVIRNAVCNVTLMTCLQHVAIKYFCQGG